jgi:hypothetical protein
VDDDLAKMKAGRLKSGNGAKAQLPEGRPYDQVFKKDAIDEVWRLMHVARCMTRVHIFAPASRAVSCKCSQAMPFWAVTSSEFTAAR